MKHSSLTVADLIPLLITFLCLTLYSTKLSEPKCLKCFYRSTNSGMLSFSHFALNPTEQPGPMGTLFRCVLNQLYMYVMETKLCSNSNNLELHKTGNACLVLHSNCLTDSNDSGPVHMNLGQ